MFGCAFRAFATTGDVDINIGLEVSDTYAFEKAGDIKMDGKVDLKDAITLLKYVMGNAVVVNKRAIAVNNDGDANLNDALYHSQHIAGWRDRFLYYHTNT